MNHSLFNIINTINILFLEKKYILTFLDVTSNSLFKEMKLFFKLNNDYNI